VIPLRRTFGSFAVLAAVALVPAPASAATARTWHVDVGAQTRNQAVQANGFFVRNITIDVGDTITWDHPDGEIHTVTFLSGTPEPPLFTISGNQLIPNGPAFGPAGGSTYNGTGYTNSGVLATVGQTYSLTFTASGTFHYICLVHEGMQGVVRVNKAGTPYPASQAEYRRKAKDEEAELLERGRDLEGAAREAAARLNVIAGIGQLVPKVGALAVLRFEPDKRVVHVGQTVTWTNRDPQTPHTVTFGTEPPGGPFGAFAPSGDVSSGHATISSTTQSVNSGFIAKDPTFGVRNTFSATFTAPGTYPYICALHDDLGMKGTILVVP
jgi:plastocyanin